MNFPKQEEVEEIIEEQYTPTVTGGDIETTAPKTITTLDDIYL